jgi:hypothetical protein
MAFLAIFKSISAGNLPIFLPFLYILGGLEGLFDCFDTIHHHPWPGTPPTNSWSTKQFLSHPHGL